jgi:hypothetical protein
LASIYNIDRSKIDSQLINLAYDQIKSLDLELIEEYDLNKAYFTLIFRLDFIGVYDDFGIDSYDSNSILVYEEFHEPEEHSYFKSNLMFSGFVLNLDFSAKNLIEVVKHFSLRENIDSLKEENYTDYTFYAFVNSLSYVLDEADTYMQKNKVFKLLHNNYFRYYRTSSLIKLLEKFYSK